MSLTLSNGAVPCAQFEIAKKLLNAITRLVSWLGWLTGYVWLAVRVGLVGPPANAEMQCFFLIFVPFLCRLASPLAVIYYRVI